MLKSYFAFGAVMLLTAAPVLAQSTSQSSGAMSGSSTGQTGNSNPAVKDSDPKTIGSAAMGANSFTRDQARARFAKAGYRVSTLTKDAQGVWMGKAMKGGKAMNVGLDYKGNVSVR